MSFDWSTAAVVISVLCIALAAITAAAHRVPAHRACGTYLTAAAGLSDRLTQPRRRLLWRQAFTYATHILRLRKRWSALGLHLQTPRIQDLVIGLSRRAGTLTRISDAASVETPRAKIRAQPRRRSTAASLSLGDDLSHGREPAAIRDRIVGQYEKRY